jgi:predicted nucleotidyltransferase
MRIVATLAEKATAAGLPFLIIGGNAVIAYGYPRMTSDVDLLVREKDRRAWDELIVPIGYRAHQINRAFHMYSPIPRELPPLDLMLVDDATFEKLSADATEIVLAEKTVRIPSLRHLIAMKLHALRSGQPHRREKDMGDVLTLMQVNSVDLASPEYVEILTRYATADLAAEIQLRFAGSQFPGS